VLRWEHKLEGWYTERKLEGWYTEHKLEGWYTEHKLEACATLGVSEETAMFRRRSDFIPSPLVGWIALLILSSGAVMLHAQAPELVVTGSPGEYRMAVADGGRVLLQAPEEGQWSIAMDWLGDWPSQWQHARIQSVEKVGEWTVLHGALETPSGTWKLSDACRPEKGLIRCTRRFEWHGDRTLDRCTLSVRFQTPGQGTDALLPGILYFGNPSGARSGRTPVFSGNPGEEAVFEEHRFPMPFAALEWQGSDRTEGAALHSLPSPVPFGNLPDQWWSLGLKQLSDGVEMMLLSGPCASNGRRSVVKAMQEGFLPYPDAYLNIPPGAIIEKSFYLDAYPVSRAGSGFERPVRSSLRLFRPTVTGDLPSFREIVDAKLRYADSRWTERNGAEGFRKYPDKDILVMGWCGQAEALGYALQVLGKSFPVENVQERVQRSLDFLSTAEFYEGGFRTWYHMDSGRWDHDEPLSQGQAMLSIGNAIRVAGPSGFRTSKWEDFLRRASDFHAARILRSDWTPVSTDQAFFIAPLCAAHALFGSRQYLDAAVKAAEVYAGRSLSMREPYWGGTLDASCEDKEGAFAAFQGFLALYKETGDARYLDWARHAAAVTLTYTFVWDVDLPAGRLRDHAFKTRGWTAVSVQNQHIDVYGVLIAPYVYELGRLTGDRDLQELALLMFRSCGQLIDPYGSQGEQPQETNYTQGKKPTTAMGLRGDYVENWTVFWITAHFLNAAAQFAEAGVAIQ